jgi:hypothetical protein
MLRTIKIGAIVTLANVMGAQSAGAENLTWGVFRETAPNVSEAQRNCWSQAMVTGLTINGEVLAEHLTQEKAELELQKLAKRGLCAAERTNPSWTARGEGQTIFGQSDSGGSSFGGSNASGSGSDWSNASQFDANGGQSHAGPMGGGH